jgi:hypothetical protein
VRIAYLKILKVVGSQHLKIHYTLPFQTLHIANNARNQNNALNVLIQMQAYVQLVILNIILQLILPNASSSLVMVTLQHQIATNMIMLMVLHRLQAITA